MSYTFLPNTRYRMPTHFGPSLGPRQGLDGCRFANIDTPNETVMQATFNADKSQLEAFLPPGFALREPTINFVFSFLTNIEWLAGRGYNTFSVLMPVSYTGVEETVVGDLMLTVWENNADCIITGREDLGVAKIYCDIPGPRVMGDDVICRASWDGFEFASLKLSNVREVVLEDLPESPENDGILHYKYIPKTGAPGEADVKYAVLLPSAWPNTKLDQVKVAEKATINFQESTWEQLPTLVHIVNTIAGLKIGDCIDASILKLHGGKDLSDVRIIR